MKKLFLIKRKRELVIEIDELPIKKRRGQTEGIDIKITSIVMISRRIDEFEESIRKKMESEMRIFSCKTHSQEFLRSLIPSLNKDRKC